MKNIWYHGRAIEKLTTGHFFDGLTCYLLFYLKYATLRLCDKHQSAKKKNSGLKEQEHGAVITRGFLPPCFISRLDYWTAEAIVS